MFLKKWQQKYTRESKRTKIDFLFSNYEKKINHIFEEKSYIVFLFFELFIQSSM